MVELSTRIGELRLKNPLILASGILGETGESLLKVIKEGAGAVVTKSIGLEARAGYGNPTLVELPYGFLNAFGLPNPGIDEYEREIKMALTSEVPVIGSVFGRHEGELVKVARKMESFGADAIELNLSCPHVEHYGLKVGQYPMKVAGVVRAVKKSLQVPLLTKLSPNVTDIVSIAKAVEKANGDAIVAINTVRAMAINLETSVPVLSNKIGGYSGAAIKPIGVRCVYEIVGEVNVPVIGVGGIMSGRDAIEYLMAGASAVEIGSAVYYRGVDVFKRICDEMSKWMGKNGYDKVSELIGLALNK